MNDFFVALQFLTRIPLTINLQWEAENIAGSLLWYPLVGVLIGIMLTLLAGIMPGGSSMLAAALVLSGWVFITGGLHLDGLADSADAWVGSHGERQRALEIMKDPQAGPIAVIVLVLLLLVKFAAIYGLLEQGELWLLILPPLLGRCVPLLLFLSTDYVREKGLGSAMAEFLPRESAQEVLLLVAIILPVLTGFINALLLISITLLVIWFLRNLMLKHIGGMTGDTIGAAIEITETTALCILLLSFS